MRKYFFLRFYLFIHERQREGEREREREKQAPCREPDVGFDPGTPGLHPELKAGAKPLGHPVILEFSFISFFSKDFIYLFMRDRERRRDTGRGRSRLHAGRRMWDSIPGLQDHTTV